jgi:putative transposase
MARPLRIEFPGAYYHVTSRGNEQKDVFRSKRDREKFIEYLASSSDRYGAVIHAYCLMSNHYHLLLETPEANLSQIMRHINGAYTTYFNVKRHRSGHLFQGRFKAILVDADEYLGELSRYIHLNPVRAAIVERPEQYTWSSYHWYTARGNGPPWLKTCFILGRFSPDAKPAREKYRLFVEDRLGKEHGSPLAGVVASSMLGSASFIGQISERHLQGKIDENIPALRKLCRQPTPEDILSLVTSADVGDDKVKRRLAMYLCHTLSGRTLKEIGSMFNVRDTAVSEASRRVIRELDSNSRLRGIVVEIQERLKQ